MLQPGDVAGGKYQVVRPLGEGGMAVVFEAVHTGTQRRCALKLVRAQLAKNKRVVDKFLSEAQFAGRIGRHPHIVDVFDTGLDERLGAPFIAMELLEGQSLSDYVAAQGPLPHATVAELMRQLGSALAVAHRAGVVHRDLKPANLFLTRDHDGRMQLKVLDFGIAKVLSEAQGTATTIGTPLYAAPEQMGEGLRKMATMHGITVDKAITPATDIWGVAMIAYELLSGRDPERYWQAATLGDLLLKLASNERPPPSTTSDRAALPPGFDAWFYRCTEIDASRRPQTCAEAIDGLCGLLGAPPVQPTAQPTVPGAPGQAAWPQVTGPQLPVTGPPTPHGSWPAQPSVHPSVHPSGHPSGQSWPGQSYPSQPMAQPSAPGWSTPPPVTPQHPHVTGLGVLLEVAPMQPRRSSLGWVLAVVAVLCFAAGGVWLVAGRRGHRGRDDTSEPTRDKRKKRRDAAASASAAIEPLPDPAPTEPGPTDPPDADRGRLALTSSPQAHVAVDGQPRGTTPIQLDVAAGQHTVTFTFAGEVEHRVVTVEPGATETLSVSFQAPYPYPAPAQPEPEGDDDDDDDEPDPGDPMAQPG
jgi:serine/threonine protein kinase